MMFGLDNKSKFLKIEINDERIDSEISKLIAQVENYVDELKQALTNDDISTKEEDLAELAELFSKIMQDVDRLLEDLNVLQVGELNKRELITHGAKEFLDNKALQLGTIKTNLSALIGIVHDRPSKKEFQEEGLLEALVGDLNRIKEAMTKLKKDDVQLEQAYKAIKNDS